MSAYSGETIFLNSKIVGIFARDSNIGGLKSEGSVATKDELKFNILD